MAAPRKAGLPRLTDKEAKAAYLALGPDRSLSRLRAWLHEHRTDMQLPSERTIAEWCSKGAWVAEAERHDAAVSATVGKVLADAQGKSLAETVGVTPAEVLQEYVRLGFANIVEFLRIAPNGEFTVDLSVLQQRPELGRLIQEIQIDSDEIISGADANTGEPATVLRKKVKIKLWNKLDALAKLGTHLGILKEPAGGGTTNINFNQTNVTNKVELKAGVQAKLTEIFGELVTIEGKPHEDASPPPAQDPKKRH